MSASPLPLADIVTPESRDAICGACGAEGWKQFKLTPRFVATARAAGPALDRVIPDGFVPLDCPSCERKNLSGGREAHSPISYRASADRDYARFEREGLQMADA